MTEHLLVGLASVLVIGISAQWLAWRFNVPSILLLLIAGFVAGPITGVLHPDALLGDLLTPVVSLSVGIILFEGGLTLQTSELRSIGHVLRNLVTVGALVTWVITTLAAHFLAGLSWEMSILLGAILVVTGPTVIGPLLRHIGSVGRVGSLLKWEGIVIDPIGATLAVLVFEAILRGELQQGAVPALYGMLKTALVGGGIGLLGAALMIIPIKRHWLPESLDVPVTLMMVVAIFTLADVVQSESGLLATTVMGMALANQRNFSVKHIVEFKENLRVLLIASLFVLLAARLQLSEIATLDWGSVLFLAVVMFVGRPASVLVATIGSPLSWKERLFLAWMAPRGIVAAAVASIFALELTEGGYPEAARLVPLTFLVIVGTVTIYGLTARPFARWLKLSQEGAGGVLFLGAHTWARSIAAALQKAGFPVLLVDNNRSNSSAAQMEGLTSYYGNILSDYAQETLNLEGMGRFLALTPNEEVNSLATLYFANLFGRENVYQFPPKVKHSQREGPVTRPLRGRQLFGEGITYEYLDERFAAGATVKSTKLSNEFRFTDLQEHYGGTIIPLFLVGQSGQLVIYTVNESPKPQPGQTLIFLAEPRSEAQREISRRRNSDEAQQPVSFPDSAALPQ